MKKNKIVNLGLKLALLAVLSTNVFGFVQEDVPVDQGPAPWLACIAVCMTVLGLPAETCFSLCQKN